MANKAKQPSTGKNNRLTMVRKMNDVSMTKVIKVGFS
jgi:hypothetical protein